MSTGDEGQGHIRGEYDSVDDRRRLVTPLGRSHRREEEIETKQISVESSLGAFFT